MPRARVHHSCQFLNFCARHRSRCRACHVDPVLYFHEPHLVALRREDRNEEASATGNGGIVPMHRACARTLSPRSFRLSNKVLDLPEITRKQ